MQNIPGTIISYNKFSKRIINLTIKKDRIKKLVDQFFKFEIMTLEYKPFTRFTIAKIFDEIIENKLSIFLNEILRDRNTGCLIISPENYNDALDDNFLVKFSTAIAYLVGNPNHDSMAGKYYARFHVKHEDKSDSYLRKAYTNMDLHTDGTYVKEITDWLLMTKIEEKNVIGGESVMLHLDDWEHFEEMFKDPIGKENFTWSSPKSKNVSYKVEHPVFLLDKQKRPVISYIDQFPEPKNMKQGNFLQKLSDNLEGSKMKIITELPVGSLILANNHFWLHGRKTFKENTKLSRELLRIRGAFFN